jgi:hypothetical protein
VLTVLEYAGSAIIAVFYVTILVALATRKTGRKQDGAQAPMPAPEFDRVS